MYNKISLKLNKNIKQKFTFYVIIYTFNYLRNNYDFWTIQKYILIYQLTYI